VWCAEDLGGYLLARDIVMAGNHFPEMLFDCALNVGTLDAGEVWVLENGDGG
jgi:hypothetical protein